MRIILSILVALIATSCSAPPSDPSYTGVLSIDLGTEYAALEEPSTIGGACEGWNAVEIRKPGASGTGMTNVVCWKRDGDNITLSDKTGAQRKSGPASSWSN